MAGSALTRSVQENLLLTLIWSDEFSKVVRASIEPALWDEGYFKVVEAVAAYIDRYNAAPKEHIVDLMEPLIEGKDTRRAEFYKRLLGAFLNSKDSVNPQYAIDKLVTFRRRQVLKQAVIDAVPLLQSENEDDVDKAEATITSAMRNRLENFDDGLVMSDTKRALLFMTTSLSDEFTSGIRELDRNGAVPARKTIILLIGLAKYGKSWWLTHLGKSNLIAGKRVLHITLENSEQITSQRYIQSLYELAKRERTSQRSMLLRDNQERVERLVPAKAEVYEHLREPRAEQRIRRRMLQRSAMLSRLRIKEFPTGELTIDQLEAFLDGLEVRHNFIPDLLLVDYADLMKLEGNDPRLALGTLLRRLRGIGVRRNMAIATVKQSNREGEGAKLLRGRNAAEDWSAIGTADTVLTYNQTEAEHQMQVARLWVDAARSDMDRYQVLLLQDYTTGQFAHDSAMLDSPSALQELIDKAAVRRKEPERSLTK